MRPAVEEAMQFVIFWSVGFFFCWENSFNKGPNLLQHLNAINHQCLVILHLDANMKTQRLLGLDWTALHYFLPPRFTLFPSRITDASLIGKMQSVQVVLALWLNILSCCTIMLTLLFYAGRAHEKNPRSTVLVQATTKAILLVCWLWEKRFYRDGHLGANQLVWLEGSCTEESQWHTADLTVLRLSYCFSRPLFGCGKKRGAAECCFQKLGVLIGCNYLIKWEGMKAGNLTPLFSRLLRDELNYFSILWLCPLKYKVLQLHVSVHVF